MEFISQNRKRERNNQLESNSPSSKKIRLQESPYSAQSTRLSDKNSIRSKSRIFTTYLINNVIPRVQEVGYNFLNSFIPKQPMSTLSLTKPSIKPLLHRESSLEKQGYVTKREKKDINPPNLTIPDTKIVVRNDTPSSCISKEDSSKKQQTFVKNQEYSMAAKKKVVRSDIPPSFTPCVSRKNTDTRYQTPVNNTRLTEKATSSCKQIDTFQHPISLIHNDSDQKDPTFAKKTVVSSDIPLSFKPFIRRKHSFETDPNFETNGETVVTKISFCGKDYILKYPSHLSRDYTSKTIISDENNDVSVEIIAYTKINNEHPNIVKLLHIYNYPAPALLLEYCESLNLRIYLNQNIPDIEFFFSLSLIMTDALCFLHNKGIIHGDIKDENILVCMEKDKKVNFKLCDFGLNLIEPFNPNELHKIPFCCYVRQVRPPEVNDSFFYSNHSMDVYAFGRVIQIYYHKFNMQRQSSDENVNLLKKLVYDLTTLAVQIDIKKRITAQAWHTSLLEKAPPCFLSQNKK